MRNYFEFLYDVAQKVIWGMITGRERERQSWSYFLKVWSKGCLLPKCSGYSFWCLNLIAFSFELVKSFIQKLAKGFMQLGSKLVTFYFFLFAPFNISISTINMNRNYWISSTSVILFVRKKLIKVANQYNWPASYAAS